MAKYRQIDYQRCIEADDGTVWSRERNPAILAVSPHQHVTLLRGRWYSLEKYRTGEDSDHMWYLYERATMRFHAEPCAPLLLDAVDRASELIVKADLRGEGYEKET